MPKSQVDSVALTAATLAATLALTLLLGPFAWMGSIIGLILLLVLFGFDQEGYRTLLGSLAYSAVCGLCFALACGAVFKLLSERGEVHLANEQWATEWLPFALAFGTAFLWAIDRSRMGARVPAADRLASRRGAAQRSFINYDEPAAAATYAPPANPVPDAAPLTSPVPTPEPHNTYSQEPVIQQPVYAAAPPISEPSRVAHPQSMLTPATAETVRPAPTPIIPRGKETMIYINLLGEGLNVMRSVTAEHVGRDYYKIVDTMPEGETWQFQPGQVVRCKKQTLSTGKALVAFEEAPRSR